MQDQQDTLYHALVVPASSVKKIKTELEARGLLHRRLKITKSLQDDRLMTIPTTLTTDDLQSNQALRQADVAYIKGLAQEFATTTIDEAAQDIGTGFTKRNALESTIAASLDDIPVEILTAKGLSKDELLGSIPTSYAIYQPLLLLPVTTLARPAWKRLFFDSDPSKSTIDARLTPFLKKIAAALSVTHIAINAPIPTDTSLSTPSADAMISTAGETDEAKSFSSSNLLRSPTGLVTLCGDFGAALPPFPEHVPSEQDMEDSFWVTTTQNRIRQTWAPRYTMFSKGNVTEKARLLGLASVTQLQHQQWAAVDLFAGIGYFAFSYARAGASKVLCWDLNPWSVQGLCRGAALNGWTSSVLASPQEDRTVAADGVNGSQKQQQVNELDNNIKFLVWCESNSRALDRLSQRRADLPPVRHVNCGMLPDAGKAWKTAVQCLDWQLGGWLHLHETVREDKVDSRAEEIRQAVAALLQGLSLAGCADKTVRTEHIERVKSVGPRMLHVVVDLCISGVCGGGGVG